MAGARGQRPSDARLASWADGQRKLARALGLSIQEWLEQLDAAAERRTGLTAAVVGVAMSEGLGLSVLDRLDPPALAARARGLIDPTPPRVEHPVLAEAVRRADELAPGRGAGRLRGAAAPAVSGPRLASDARETADAPGLASGLDPEDDALDPEEGAPAGERRGETRAPAGEEPST